MRQVRVARGYAKAFVRAADDAGVRAEARDEAARLLALLEESEPFKSFVEDAMIPPKRKDEVLTELFAESFSPLTCSFLSLLVEKRRERVLADILEEALRQLDEADGIRTAEVQSAVALDDSQCEALAAVLSQMTGGTVRVRSEVAPDLVGGFVVRLGDTVYDASLAAQLTRLRRTLAGDQ